MSRQRDSKRLINVRDGFPKLEKKSSTADPLPVPPAAHHQIFLRPGKSASHRWTSKGNAFGKIDEYFLGKFAMAEGRKDGKFSTPRQAGVEAIELYQ